MASSSPAAAAGVPAEGTEWSKLVESIRTEDPGGMEQLYALFSRGIRFYLCRQLGPQELDDRVHDTFLIVVQAIRRGELRDPERLMGFVRTIVRRQVAAHIDNAVQSRKEQADLQCGSGITDDRENPEERAIARQRLEIMQKVLGSISERDREILTRFYLLGQSQEQICKEMKLTETQFRLLKSRAKARFGEFGKRKLQRRGLFSRFCENFDGDGRLFR
ncbi:MAG: sigma-70 family RNA polymerase sigma factor [Acidobacteria bacterium]|nr:sigma-70 family RNA polymerase sigma factor [Acidobacteriota bacterium]